MNIKEIAAFVAALDEALVCIPGLVDEKHVANLNKLRGILDLVTQIKK